MSPRFVIIGAGAIGGTVGHAMVKAGQDVVLVDTDAAHVEAVRDGGLRIRAADGTDDAVKIAAFTPEDYPADAPPADFAVVATKSA